MQSNTLMFGSHCQYKELGALLESSRISKNISLKKMADILKVSILRLEQIESGNFSMMHEIYTKSLIKRYAKELNINVEKSLDNLWSPTTMHSVAGSLIEVINIQNNKIAINNNDKYINFYKIIYASLIAFLIIFSIKHILTNKKNISHNIVTKQLEEYDIKILKQNIIFLKLDTEFNNYLNKNIK